MIKTPPPKFSNSQNLDDKVPFKEQTGKAPSKHKNRRKIKIGG
jgi:hypothetical protein